MGGSLAGTCLASTSLRQVCSELSNGIPAAWLLAREANVVPLDPIKLKSREPLLYCSRNGIVYCFELAFPGAVAFLLDLFGISAPNSTSLRITCGPGPA